MNGQELQYSDAYKSEVEFILRNPALDNLKKQQMIKNIQQKHKNSLFKQKQAELKSELNVKKKEKQTKKNKKLKLQPSYKERLLFEDYNVGIQIPDIEDYPRPDPYSLTEGKYFESKSKSIKQTAKKGALLSPKLQSNNPLSDKKNKKRQSEALAYGQIEDIGLMLPSIQAENKKQSMP